MRCQLVRARRDGVPLSKSNRPKPDEGTLEVLPSVGDNVLGRSVTVARFTGNMRHELINVEIVKLSGDRLVLSGLERRYS